MRVQSIMQHKTHFKDYAQALMSGGQDTMDQAQQGSTIWAEQTGPGKLQPTPTHRSLQCPWRPHHSNSDPVEARDTAADLQLTTHQSLGCYVACARRCDEAGAGMKPAPTGGETTAGCCQRPRGCRRAGAITMQVAAVARLQIWRSCWRSQSCVWPLAARDARMRGLSGLLSSCCTGPVAPASHASHVSGG